MTLLNDADQAFVAGTLASGALYGNLRADLTNAAASGANGDHLGERLQLQLFVQALQVALVIQCNTPGQSCFQVTATAANALLLEANAIIATL